MICENKSAGEDNSIGEYTDEEITLWGRDALLRIPLIKSAGDGLPLLVILNLLRIEFLFVKGKNFRWRRSLSGDVTGDNLLYFCGDNPLNSAGNDPLNSAGEIYFVFRWG